MSLLIVVDCSFKQPGVVCKSKSFFTPDDDAASIRRVLTTKATIAHEKKTPIWSEFLDTACVTSWKKAIKLLTVGL